MLEPTTRAFHDRPFQVLDAARFTGALMASIADPALRDLPVTGAIDHLSDNTDVLTSPGVSRALTVAATRPEDGTDAFPT